MAGIGFELKKIFQKHSMTSVIKGFSYGTFVSVGPLLISIIMLIIIGKILKAAQVPIKDRELLIAAIMYAYVFSMIIVSGLAMLVTRYVADKLYVDNRDDILSSLVGVLAVGVLLGGTIGALFYLNSPLPFVFKLLAYLFYLEMAMIYILMAYVLAVKDYKKITRSFGIGVLITIILALLFQYLGLEIITAVLSAMVIGFFVNVVLLATVIRQYFNVINNNVFDFLGYLKTMPKLFFINFFYTLGLFVHNIIMWLYSTISVKLGGTYFFSPAYDTATFFAILTIIPAIVLFVVKVETSFYEKYRNFCKVIVDGGSLRDLVFAKGQMVDILKRELSYIIEVQFIITLALIVLGVNIILPLFSNDSKTIELYIFLAIGYFLTYMTFIMMTMLLYFDNQEDTLKIAAVFVVGTIVFTFTTILLGEQYYGLGLCLGSFLSLIISIKYLNSTINNIDYRLFSKESYRVEN